MPPALVIYNPNAGRGRARAIWPRVLEALREAGVAFDAVATKGPLDAMTLAAKAHEEHSSVVCAGGDGTVHEVVNGLMRASAGGETLPMGLVPLGSGDDFAKMIPPEAPIGGRPFDWRGAVRKIARGETRLFDVGRLTGDRSSARADAEPRYFVNNLDVGFGAQGALNMTAIPKFLKGTSAYLATAVMTMIDYPVLHLRLTLEDQPPFDQATTMAAVMNGRCLGGGFWVCPQARADDGCFELMVIQAIGRAAILRMIPKIMRGTHAGEPVVRMYRARRVAIESREPLAVTADGEIPYLDAHRVEAEILPGRLRVMV